MKDIDHINDRSNLVLMKYWKDKPWKWEKKYSSLCNRYVDNKKYEESIISELKYIDLIEVGNSEMIRNEHNIIEYKYPELEKELYTTEKGIKALKKKSYPSEMEHERNGKAFIMFQIIGILIAAIGGIITIAKSILE